MPDHTLSGAPIDQVATRAMEIAAELEPFFDALRGKGPDVQGAVLAQLTARWLAGHMVPKSREETDAARQKIFEVHIAQTRELVAVFEREIGAVP
jgi:hypothetical protein